MTRRSEPPSPHDIQRAIDELADSTGKPPSVLAVAQRLGLSNTTFRRNCPDVVAELHTQRSTTESDPNSAVARFDAIKLENDRLKRDNHDLSAHLDLAVANIQRLTLENNRLTQQLEAATKISHLPRNMPNRSI